MVKYVTEDDAVRKVPADRWRPEEDVLIDWVTYRKYKGELYGLLVSLTTGEAKGLLNSVVDMGGEQEGFKS